MQHMIGFYENADFGGADSYLNTVQDQTLTRQAELYQVPPGKGAILATWFGTPAATRSYARLEAPSLRPLSYQYSSILNGAVTQLSDGTWQWHPYDPRMLQDNEQFQFLVNTDDAAAQDHVALVLLGDGPQQPLNGQKIFTTRATAAITQVAGTWVAGALTFTDKLPVGDYDVVGLRLFAATGHAGRLIFSGSDWRPGCPVLANNTAENEYFRYGRMGVMGTFNILQPPQLEMLGGTATAQTLFLDLIEK